MKTLKELREAKGLTQMDLSLKTKGVIKPNTLGDIENDRVTMSERAAKAMAPVLGTTPEELRVSHALGVIKQKVAKKGFKDSITYLLGVAEKEDVPTEVRLAVLKGLRSAINAIPTNDRDAYGRRDGFGRVRDSQDIPRDATGRVQRDAQGRVRNNG